MGRRGLLFWSNKIAYASVFVLLGEWVGGAAGKGWGEGEQEGGGGLGRKQGGTDALCSAANWLAGCSRPD